MRGMRQRRRSSCQRNNFLWKRTMVFFPTPVCLHCIQPPGNCRSSLFLWDTVRIVSSATSTGSSSRVSCTKTGANFRPLSASGSHSKPLTSWPNSTLQSGIHCLRNPKRPPTLVPFWRVKSGNAVNLSSPGGHLPTNQIPETSGND